MTQVIKVPKKLIEKYDGNLPRYTSYPTAPNFHADFDHDDYRTSAHSSNQKILPRALSVYVHIPFCHSLCYFCGCNKVVTQPGASKIESYLDALVSEIHEKASLFDQDRLVQQIHFGGGTPNFLSVNQLRELLEEIAQSFHLDLPSKLEVSIELDPRHITPEDVHELGDIGFNRFSIGVQDFAKPVQEAVNRTQSKRKTLEIIEAAKEVGESVNIDLITGLPKQNYPAMQSTLTSIINCGVSRIAAYSFAYLPDRIRAQRLINQDHLPSAEQRVNLTQLVSSELQEAGYQHIGMDHYTLASDSLYKAQQDNSLQRNFQGYTTHAETDLVGIGVSAISSFDNAYAQNTTSISDYISAINCKQLPIIRGVTLSKEDQLRQKIIQAWMCAGEVDFSVAANTLVEGTGDQTLREKYSKEYARLETYQQDGLLNYTKTGAKLAPLGRYFMRPIAAEFDAYLNIAAQDNNNISQFSRAL